MRSKTFRYLISEGVRGLQRHRGLSFTAIITMSASLLVLGVFLVTSYNVTRVISGLEGRKQVVVYLKDGVTDDGREMLRQRLHMHPAVAAAQFVSRDEAWDDFVKNFRGEGLLETIGGNPLPDGFRVALRPEGRDAPTIRALTAEVRLWDEVDEVISGGEWVGRLDRFAHSALIFTAAIGIAVGLSIVLIVSNTVRLTVLAREDLIHIMKSVGASETFIRIPFLSEGVMQAFVAGLVALAALFGGTFLLSDRIAGVEFLSPLWAVGFLGLAVFLGFVGSSLSVRHVLRQAGL